MSDFDDLKTPKVKKKRKVKRYLKGVKFDFDGAHIAMTSGLGAASEMNDFFLTKSKDNVEKSLELSEEEISILKEIGEYDESLNKEKTTEHVNTNKDKKEKETKTMSDNVIDKKETNAVSMEDFLALKKEVDAAKMENQMLISKSLIKDVKFNDDDEDKQTTIEKGVADILAKIDVEDRELLVKSFLSAINLATAEVVEKDKKSDKNENPLKKALEDETGVANVDQKEDKEVKKSLSDLVAEELAKANGINKEGN